MNEERNNYKAWFYLLPAIILMAIFTLYPLINALEASFLKNYNVIDSSNDGFTFDNYGVVLGLIPKSLVQSGDPTGSIDYTFTRYALLNTFIIVIVTVPVSVILALIISIALNRIKVLHDFLQSIFFLPYITNIIALGMVFSIIFSPTGIFNNILGLNISWVENPTWAQAMFVLCLYVIWNALPYKILIFSIGLQNIDQQYYQAARIDGVSRWRVNTQVTIPLLSPQILYITITSFISAFKEYSAVVGLFNRSYTRDGNIHDLYTVVYYIYDFISGETTLWYKEIQYASAAAMILFLIIMAITLLQMRVAKRRVYY